MYSFNIFHAIGLLAYEDFRKHGFSVFWTYRRRPATWVMLKGSIAASTKINRNFIKKKLQHRGFP